MSGDRLIAAGKQRGLSLVELLIALLISSLLIIGITQIYLDNKRNYLFQQGQAGNLENARFASLLLDSYLNKAGYRRAPEQAMDDAFPAATPNGCMAFAKGSAIVPTSDGLGLCIRYQPLYSTEPDCQGNASAAFDDSSAFSAPPSSSLITLIIRYRAANPTSELHTGALSCQAAGGASPTELLGGVADFRLELGLGTPGVRDEKKLKVSPFVSAADWKGDCTDGPIRAVRYRMLLASEANRRDDSTAPKALTEWLDSADSATRTRLQSHDQRRLYHAIGGNLILRNLMP